MPTELVRVSRSEGVSVAEAGIICSDCGWQLSGVAWWAVPQDAREQHELASRTYLRHLHPDQLDGES